MPVGFKAGGRVAGVPNKATIALRELVEDAAGGPLPVLLAQAGRKAYDAGDVGMAVAAWAKAATYCYARPHGDTTPPAPPIVIIDDIPQLDTYPGPLVRINRPPIDEAITGQKMGN